MMWCCTQIQRERARKFLISCELVHLVHIMNLAAMFRISLSIYGEWGEAMGNNVAKKGRTTELKEKSFLANDFYNVNLGRKKSILFSKRQVAKISSVYVLRFFFSRAKPFHVLLCVVEWKTVHDVIMLMLQFKRRKFMEQNNWKCRTTMSGNDETRWQERWWQWLRKYGK